MISERASGMRQFKRLFYLVLINVVVSAITVILVLNYWEQRNPMRPQDTQSASILNPTSIIPPDDVQVLSDTTVPVGEGIQVVLAEPTLGEIEPIPSSTPTLTVFEYEVKEDDSLGSLAERFGVSVSDILALNEIENPDILSIGQVLYIPTGPVPQPTDLPSATPTEPPSPTITPSIQPTIGPSATPVPTNAEQEAEVMIDSVIGVGDLSSERVVLIHQGEGEVSLADWRLEDEDGNFYVFPQLDLYRGGAVNVHTRAGLSTVVDLFWGLEAPVWKPGELVTLLDVQGTERATYLIP
jgi:LysM repeat protein